MRSNFIHRSAGRRLRLLAAVLFIAILAGCDPVVYNVRIRPEIANVEDRAISFQMITPMNATDERVIYHGVLVSAIIENSKDTIDDFCLGYVTLDELDRDPIKILKTESGETQVFLIKTPPNHICDSTIYLRAIVPALPNAATIRWENEQSPPASTKVPPGEKYKTKE